MIFGFVRSSREGCGLVYSEITAFFSELLNKNGSPAGFYSKTILYRKCEFQFIFEKFQFAKGKCRFGGLKDHRPCEKIIR